MPRPTVIENLYGRPGKRPPPKDEPIPEGFLTEEDAPASLSEDQKRIWAYYLNHSPRGLLTPLDRGVLAVYVVAESLFLQASALQSKRPMVTQTATKAGTFPIVSPYLPIIRQYAAEMRQAAHEMGFTPSSRTRIKAEPDAKTAASTASTRDDKGKGPKRSLDSFLDDQAA